eukprot:m.13154 g.13154  ORF g.13154 m.13154 type:complete len:518 (-) comp6138_c0_seq1:313-1866(-)
MLMRTGSQSIDNTLTHTQTQSSPTLKSHPTVPLMHCRPSEEKDLGVGGGAVVVARAADEHPPRSVDQDPHRLHARHSKVRGAAIGAEDDDAMVVVVGNENIAHCIHRNPARLVELALAAAADATVRTGHAAVGVDDQDAAAGSINHIDHALAVDGNAARALQHLAGVQGREGPDDDAVDGVENLQPIVVAVTDNDAAVDQHLEVPGKAELAALRAAAARGPAHIAVTPQPTHLLVGHVRQHIVAAGQASHGHGAAATTLVLHHRLLRPAIEKQLKHASIVRVADNNAATRSLAHPGRVLDHAGASAKGSNRARKAEGSVVARLDGGGIGKDHDARDGRKRSGQGLMVNKAQVQAAAGFEGWPAGRGTGVAPQHVRPGKHQCNGIGLSQQFSATIECLFHALCRRPQLNLLTGQLVDAVAANSIHVRNDALLQPDQRLLQWGQHTCSSLGLELLLPLLQRHGRIAHAGGRAPQCADGIGPRFHFFPHLLLDSLCFGCNLGKLVSLVRWAQHTVQTQDE